MQMFCLILHAVKWKIVAKADRLLTLISLLKGRRTVITARQLAETLEISERTVYRDIQLLIDTGLPIEGEAGVGYMLKSGADIPPIMFTSEELLAIQLGLKMVKGWTDKALAIAAEQARIKIEAVLPERLKQTRMQHTVLIPEYYIESISAQHSIVIREAIANKCGLNMVYEKADTTQSTRMVIPLGLVHWGKTWTLVAWCFMRNDYREFRLDRIQGLSCISSDHLPHLPAENNEISLEAYVAQLKL